MIEANQENFDKLIEEGNILADFYATWCGPCKMLAKEIDEISDKVKIIKINIDENLELCKRFGVMSVPTLIYFKKDKTYDVKVGYMPKEEILNWIQKIS